MQTMINTNMSAITGRRNFRAAKERQSTAAERLTTGRRINRIGDGAATLAISEGMRNQIRGLDRATRNVQEGTSMVQVAEGALAEIHDRLDRASTLTEQAQEVLNRPYHQLVIKTEVRQLMKELEMIIHNTTFNNQRIFVDGYQGNHVSGNQHVIIPPSVGATPPDLSDAYQYFLDHVLVRSIDHFMDYATPNDAPPGHWMHEFLTEVTARSWVETLEFFPGFHVYLSSFYHEDRLQVWGRLLETHVLHHIPGATLSQTGRDFFVMDLDRSDFVLQDWIRDGPLLMSVAMFSNYAEARAWELHALRNLDMSELGTFLSLDFFEFDGDLLADSGTGGGGAVLIPGDGRSDDPSFTLQLQSGANSGQRFDLVINRLSMDSLGLSDFSDRLGQAMRTTNPTFDTLLTELNHAMAQVSGRRADLRSTQHRLESVLSNLDNSSGHLTDAFANALNAEMATKALEVSKTNLLIQRSIAIMVQANTSIDSVSQLVNAAHVPNDDQSFENTESVFNMLSQSRTSFVEVPNGEARLTLPIRPRHGFRPIGQRSANSLDASLRLVSNVSFGHLSIHNNH